MIETVAAVVTLITTFGFGFATASLRVQSRTSARNLRLLGRALDRAE